jgi:uncharacterized protein (TIGR02284 family)
MSDDKSVNALKDVTRMLIDSQKGYEMARDLVADNDPKLYARLSRRAEERENLVERFQTELLYRGTESVEGGGVMGELHRSFTQLTSLFRSDIKAALDAIDDSEETLADRIAHKLDENGLDARVRALLETASLRAEQGEAFADRLSDEL